MVDCGGLLSRRLKRVRALLDHLPSRDGGEESTAKRRCLDRLSERARGLLMGTSATNVSCRGEAPSSAAASLPTPLSSLPGLLTALEDDVIATELAVKVTSVFKRHNKYSVWS